MADVIVNVDVEPVTDVLKADGEQPATRIRILTEKGMDSYTRKRDELCTEMELNWTMVEPLLTEAENLPCDVRGCLAIEQKIAQASTNYNRRVDACVDFLKSHRSDASHKELESCYTLMDIRQRTIDAVTLKLQEACQSLEAAKSNSKAPSSKGSSHSSRTTLRSNHSKSSDVSSLAKIKRAKAEAAKANLTFAEQHAAMLKQGAELDRKNAELKAELTLLESRRDVAVAEAEAQALENEIIQQPAMVTPTENVVTTSKHTFNHTSNSVTQLSSMDYQLPSVTATPAKSKQPVVSHLNRNATTFVPVAQQLPPARVGDNMTDITKFLLRKDLLFSRLTNFNDRAESYYSWKIGFKCVINELQVSDSEELDLLVKWLGMESSKHAISIRASNADNPTRGIQRLWQRLDERYGSPEMVEASLKNKLSSFPKLTNRDNARLYELSDILSEIEYTKENPQFQNLLAYFDASSGIKPIVSKLPYGLQEKWTTRAVKYNTQHKTLFPPFTEFSSFIREMSHIKNNPGFNYDSDLTSTLKPATGKQTFQTTNSVYVRRTGVDQTSEELRSNGQLDRCILHQTRHSLNDCRGFRAKPIEERRKLLQQHNVCFKCCDSTAHKSRECDTTISCKECRSKLHTTALHITKNNQVLDDLLSPQSVQDDGGELRNSDKPSSVFTVNSTCTEICKDAYSGKSCAKILPVNVFHKDHPNKAVQMYAIIDDQSNRSLASPEFFSIFNIQKKPENYTLSTCSGSVVTSGKRAEGFIMEAIHADIRLDLPVLIECDHIPDNRDEIPTPEVLSSYPHLRDLVGNIPPINENCQILLLIGRDLIEAHHVISQRIGPPRTPYAQQLKLGWVVIGEVCLDKQHIPSDVNVKRTFVMPTGQPTTLQPCANQFEVREHLTDPTVFLPTHKPLYDLGRNVFERTKDDDKPGMSYEDKVFLTHMDDKFVKEPTGSWVAPLPFRLPRQPLPNNRGQALHRAKLLDASLMKNPTKKEHFLTFMGKILDDDHAEVAPPLHKKEECWYLPLFGVYHPRKPDQIRGVFDSSAKSEGVSLNSVLLSGPDLSNCMLGVLMRFRKEMVAVTADVQHMFHCFIVQESHRNYLRFFWHKDNDFDKELIEYRMKVHVFGNSPSPAVATLGLRKTALAAEPEYGGQVTKFVMRDFYVDDGLTSCPTTEEAIKIMKDTQSALKEYGNLRLHKIASNDSEVMSAFPASDLATNLKDLDLASENKPLQRSLGLSWDLNTDKFLFQLSLEEKPTTRRGILSTINSIFDPLGFLAPVIIHGKLLLRKLVSETVDWDQPVPVEIATEWESWRDTLKVLETVRIPRTYVLYLSECTTKQLHVFSDASTSAIAAVVYLHTTNDNVNPKLGFVLGKAKVAPTNGHTIPRLELCAAVLAIEITQFVLEHLDLQIDMVKYYTDSKVVLGYINNETRRFYVYVANRVDHIRKYSVPSQWNYVPTDQNPADSATRSLQAHEIHNSNWLIGPKQLLVSQTEHALDNQHPLVEPDADQEVRSSISVAKTFTTPQRADIGTDRFHRFSDWKRLVHAIAILKRFLRSHRLQKYEATTMVDYYQDAECVILKSVQSEVYKEEIDCLQRKESVPKRSPIANLNPFLDEQGILRVGGRLINSDLCLREKKPIIIPGSHYIASLLVRHYHGKIRHQGRHFTDGAVRAAGFWVTGVKRLISSFIHKCVMCRKLRGKMEYQIMSDLPKDRLEPLPPFTNVGVDTFGPWMIVSRRTRGGFANSKRWGILFTCLVTRAVHVELVEEMSSSAFINAVRRFTAIRGAVKTFRSDRGTNFVGALDDLHIDAINVEDGLLKEFMYNSGTVWIFNPPHASHMGGAWERMIGITRRILDSMLIHPTGRTLTHDVLNTFMAEACAIINSRPLVPVSSDPESPLILTPAMLLTQKTDYELISNHPGGFNEKDLYRVEWKRVQALASVFWSRWKKEYLSILQLRRKWTDNRRDIVNGDIILLKDKNLDRNQWPIGIVINTFESSDKHIRKAEIRTIVNGKPTIYTRPVVDMIVLVEGNCI